MSAVADGGRQPIPAQIALVPHETLAKAALRRFFRHRLAMIGLAILVFVAGVAIFLPFIVPLDATKVDYTNIRGIPGPDHLLGGDLSGRDVWSRVVFGTRVSLLVGFGAVALYVAVGTVLGIAAGYFGGVTDQVIMRFTDSVLSIPLLLLVIVFVSVVGPSLGSVTAVIGLLGWPQTTRLVRGQILALREAEFITAARVVGVSNRAIVVRHLIPNILGPLSVVATFGIGSAILLEAGLSFLGLGVRPPVPSLGEMINDARDIGVLRDLPWVWIPPGIVIALIVLAVNFVGDGLRDAVDPRSTRR
jgi:peptide/nickel transport system permease protein